VTPETPRLTTLADQLRFPEGPVVLADGAIALVEIAAGCVTRIGPDGARSTISAQGGGPNGLALGPDGMLYCCNNGGFAWHEEPGHLRPIGQPEDYSGGRLEAIDPRTGTVRVLYDRCGPHLLRGPNDLVIGRDGAIWFTDLGKARGRDRDHGFIFWAAPDGSRIEQVSGPFNGGANGIALSPDERTLYVAETDNARLWAFTVQGPGVLKREAWPSANGGRLVYTAPGFRRYDSMAVQADGAICIATLVSGEITVLSPTGELVRTVEMPERMPTNICFGGPGMQTAFVTLSTTGRLVSFPWGAAGLKLNDGRG
jgi:gluconolactonase